ncbi:hypothetical protein GIB67_031469 [Kingdonia uniflora]|uniref:Uncharacterized protein n=1 Tax=Kingdonia uniflora TaxID=39325 RepID=A0A7J7MNR8_9MAGN|nr:hypothetical protein GIB67_031469 [Kingdonia uniflora]
MVKTRSMVLEEIIASEAQRLKLKYFGDQSLEMAVPASVPPTYQGLSGEEVVKAEEDFYWILRLSPLHLYQLCGGGGYRRGGGGSGGGKLVDRDTTYKVDRTNQWEMKNKVRRITPEDILQFYGVKNFMASGGSYFCASITQRRFFNLNLAGRTWNDNIIWVKGKCLQRDDEELLDLRFRSVKQSCSPCQGDWLGIEKQEFELKRVKNELEKNLARAKTDALKEVKQLKAAHATTIGQLQIEERANLDKTTEERDRLGRHLMLKGYSQEELDAIKADTYTEEEEEEVEVLEVVDGLDGVSSQIVLDNQGDDVELPEDGSEKVVKEMGLIINDLDSRLSREIETSMSLLSAQVELQVELDASRVREDHVLMSNQEFAEQFDRMKEANENWEDQFVKVDALVANGKQADMAQCRIQALEQTEELCRSDLNSCREKILEEEIRAKDSLVKRKDELLTDLPAREELNAKLVMLRARVVELQALNLEESEQYIAKLKEDAIRYDRLDADRNAWKDTYASVKVRHERLKARFAKVIVPDVARSTLLSMIVAYFVEEVKRLESERDTLLPTLSDKGCTCGAEIDCGNCLGIMETQLGSRTADLVE